MTRAHRIDITPVQATAAIGALRRVIAAGGPVDAREAEFLDVCAGALGLADARAPAVDADVVARELCDATQRLHLVYAAIVAACIDTEVAAASVAEVRRLAAALGVRTPWLATLGHMSRRRVLPIKLRLVRSSPDGRRLFARIWQEEGLAGVWRAVRFVIGGGIVDPPLASRFRRLGLLPEGTLGRTLWADFTERGLGFPGERGGLPEKMLHHDLMHVINGFPTEPAGECEIAGFYAAFSPGEPFTFVMTVLATFHLGMPVSPAIITPAVGAFDPRRFLRAFELGARLKVDVMGPWDYWSLMPLPLAEVRQRLGLPAA